MRVYLDVGWMIPQNITQTFVSSLATIRDMGGASLDLRVAVDGTDHQLAEHMRYLLSAAVPANAMSAYVMPSGEFDDPGTMEIILNAIRRSHAESIMADVGLTVRGMGAECLPDNLPVVDWAPEAPADAMQAIVASCNASAPARPNGDATLDEISHALQKSDAVLYVEDLGSAFLRSSRLGEAFGPPRLLVDVSYINKTDSHAGLQHAVHKMAESLVSTNGGRRFDSVQLVAARDPDQTKLCHVDQIGDTPGEPVTMRTADTLLMLDAAWDVYPTLAPSLETVRQYGGRIFNVVHDIAPLRVPAMVDDGLRQVFERWFRTAVAQSDALICVSKAMAHDVATYIKEFHLPHQDGLQIGWWHLGSDPPVKTGETVSGAVGRMLSREAPTLLMVGTVEPRNRQSIALDAMELIWAREQDANLLIVGREGWNASELARRMHHHPEAGRRLLWKTDASDADVNHAYQHAAALLFPGHSEGDCLTVVDAARHGLGSIASDSPPVRELGGHGVIYVPVGNAVDWADAITNFLSGERPEPVTVRTLSWQQSAQHMLEVIDEDRFEFVLRA